jgi:hypothetical protein
MTCQIGIVADGEFPIAPLPDPLVALRDLAGAALCVAGKPAGEPALDEASAQRKIRVTFRQRPHGVQVVWQHADRDCFKWISCLNRRVDMAQTVDVLHKEIT